MARCAFPANHQIKVLTLDTFVKIRQGKCGRFILINITTARVISCSDYVCVLTHMSGGARGVDDVTAQQDGRQAKDYRSLVFQYL